MNFLKRFHPRILFFLGFLSFGIGIGFWGYENSPLHILLWWIIVLWIPIIIWYWRWQILCIAWFFFLSGFFITYLHQQERINTYKYLYENVFERKNIQITGTIDKKMYTTDRSSVYRLLIDNFDTEGHKKIILPSLHASIMVEVPKNLDVHIDNKIQFTGTTLAGFSNIFQLSWFEKYAWYHKLFWKAYLWSFDIKNKSENISFRESIQKSLKKIFFQWFPKDVTSVLLGITIGNTDFMNWQLKDDFQKSGLTHILVVSGSNITFLILFLGIMTRSIALHRYIKRTIIVSLLLVYWYIVGWDVPIIRATVMGIIGYIALESGHKRSVLAFLILVAWWILIFSPLALLYDVGFGLSFGATLWIIVFYSQVEEILKKIPFLPRWIISIIWITLTASIWSFPVLIYHFGVYPIVSIFANIIIGWIIWPLLTLSLLYIILALIFPIWNILFYLGYFLFFWVKSILWVAHFFAFFPSIQIIDPFRIPISLFIISICIRYILVREDTKLFHSK